jgi:hypothetical protein
MQKKEHWTLKYVKGCKYSDEEKKQKFKLLYKFAVKDYPESGCFEKVWLFNILNKIDKLYYGGKLVPEIMILYEDFPVEYDIKNKHIAGYVAEKKRKQLLKFYMNRNLFTNLFKNNEHGYMAGGVLCKDRLECFLHVVLHETVHLLLTIMEKLNIRKDVHYHGKTFQSIINNLFGHEDTLHGLLDNYENYHSVDFIRKNTNIGDNVEAFVNSLWINGIITKKMKNKVEVEIYLNGKYLKLKMLYGMIRIPNMEKE